MSFNPNPSKQAQDVIFSLKIKNPSHPDLIFNNKQVIQTPYQKHLGMFLDDKKLNFGEHLQYIANKVNKSIGLLCKFKQTNYYLKILNLDHAYNTSFHEKMQIL